MATENVEPVRDAWHAFDRGDAEGAFGVFAPDVEWDVSRDIWGMVVGGGVYHGVDGVAAWLGDLFSAWETFELTAEEVIAAGEDQVITVLHARGRARRAASRSSTIRPG